MRQGAGVITTALQGMLILSGNFSWLNWLTIVIAISCFDDRASRVCLCLARAKVLAPIARPHRPYRAVVVMALAVAW